MSVNSVGAGLYLGGPLRGGWVGAATPYPLLTVWGAPYEGRGMPRSVFLDSSLHISKFCRYIIWRRRASATEERPGRPAGLTLGYRAGSPPERRSGASGTRNFEAVTSARV